ncbi:hypothetical protein DIPPA_64815 [Diplonema papillatum]|nr:hypothetical protein DIPPA_64815 [Diplonema papillatum]
MNRDRKLHEEDIKHILRVGAGLLAFQVILLVSWHASMVSTLPAVLLWAFAIKKSWTSVNKEADLLFAATDKAQKTDERRLSKKMK